MGQLPPPIKPITTDHKGAREKGEGEYKIEYHSYLDLITNSSTEMFMSTDKAIVKLFKEIGNIGEERGSYIKVVTFKEFYETSWLSDFKEDDLERYEKEYGQFKDEDEILIIQEDTEDESLISQLVDKLGFKRIE